MTSKVSWRLVFLVLTVGFFVGLASGLAENSAEPLELYENKYYGFPLAWRLVYKGELKTVYYDALLADIVFGIVIAAIIFAVAKKTTKLMEKRVPPKTAK